MKRPKSGEKIKSLKPAFLANRGDSYRIKHRHKKGFGFLSHSLANLLLAPALYFLVKEARLPQVALVLVLVTKWQVFAAKPRYWWVNLKNNAVDIILGISVVILLWILNPVINANLFIRSSSFSYGSMQALISILYAIWLNFLKSKSSPKFMFIQSLISQFVGLTTVSWLAGFYHPYNLPLSVYFIIIWIISYSSMRHLLFSHQDKDTIKLSVVWGSLVTLISFLQYLWQSSFTIQKAYYIPLSVIWISLAFIIWYRFYSINKMHQTNSISSTNFQQSRSEIGIEMLLLAVLTIIFSIRLII